MGYLLLSILFNVAIFIIFRLYSLWKIKTLPAIVVNYLVCIATGIAYLGSFEPLSRIQPEQPWFWFAFGLGFIFIAVFYLMAITTQRLSITVSSVAAKMSLAVPVVASLMLFPSGNKEWDILNVLGLALSFAAILLSSLRRGAATDTAQLQGYTWLLLPLGVFFGSGLIDTTINYVNLHFLSSDDAPLLPILIFAVAAVLGFILLAARRLRLGKKEILGGILLGIPNYFSVFFVVKALAEFENNGAFFYPILNISIILTSSLISVLAFREKLNKMNKLGLALATLALFLLAYQEITGYLQ